MSMIRNLTRPVAALAAAFALFSGLAEAQTAPVDPATERKLATEAALKAARPGEVEIPLMGQALLKLPKGFSYVPIPEARRWMEAHGNSAGPNFAGLVLPGGDAGWLVVLRFNKSGYVKDDDAKEWNADELLQNLKDGTEEQNAERVKKGLRELEVAGWIEKPAYDPATHRLVWSASVRGKNARDDEGSINYNTYALGREGYFSLNLITAPTEIGADKAAARTLLAALSYDVGKRYEDFNASTDKVAEYGLAALIGGVAAKKLGLFALIGAFLLKGWKIVAVAGVVLAALAGKLFGRRKATPQA
jgi:uncharacterized membrane-anchored protein